MAAGMASTAVSRYCGAKTRSGHPCKRPAGWGTPHRGRGRCSYHLGSTRSHVKRNARAEAAEFVEGQLGHLPDAEPLEISLMAVRMARGIVDFWTAELAKARAKGAEPSPAVVEGYRQSMLDAARVSKLALDAGVAERQVQIAERVAERLTLAFEDALADIAIPAKDRAKAVARYTASISRYEGEVIEGEATEA